MDSIVASFERFFDGMGIMTGEFAVGKRLIIGSLFGGFLISFVKPDIMFEHGQPRPWKLLPGNTNGADATWIPWWSVPILFAILFGVFI